ncbi:MAG: SURF1 family protein [Thalassobaculum sp.]|uniref:SURF1 family protein n=1 Tax=Thalassobaculum sp. TaxID=2022740 RepID=UPI0032ECC987
MPFRPRLWPTLFTVPAVLAMLGLGSWQLDRLAWKSALVDSFESRVSAPAVPPPAALDDPQSWQFRRVQATGRFLNDKELQMTGRPFEGNAGFHVLTPFVVADGPTVLVNRGWVPMDRRRPEARPETLPAGPVRIDGIVRIAGQKGYFVPDNEPRNDVWFTVEPAQMAAHLGIGPVAGYYIDALRPTERPTELPIGAVPTIHVRNEHLQYAITWFLLAATLIAVYVVWHRQADRKEPEDRA